MGATKCSVPNYLEHYLHIGYVNNIQITWKTIHLSVFCRTNSPSIDQSRAEGNNTECVGKKRFNGRVLPTGFGKSYKQTNKYLYCQSYTPVKAEQLT
jgi:hypothetical protein